GGQVTFVRCPNGALCPDRTTCCLQSSGQYGCCPYQFAVCCSDHQHCCPEGYRCNLSNGTCLQISTSVKDVETLLTPMVLSPQLGLNELSAEQVRCPDGNYCQDGQTCCLLSGGKYGCCPYPHAVCCSDHSSCCPEGYRCKVSTRSCIAGNSTLPMLKKVSAISGVPSKDLEPVQDNPCPDGTSCPGGMLCCLLVDTMYACCLGEDSVCCPNRGYCCQHGYKCADTKPCVPDNTTVSTMKEVITSGIKPRLTAVSVERVRCPDGNYCQDGQTCCLTTGGQFGCCPYPHAECCSDHASCCPEGYRCQISTHTCVAGNSSVAMLKKVSTFSDSAPDSPSPGNMFCPDGSACLDQQTCCQIKNGSYGCCPLPHAVCCNDLESCCPRGTLCIPALRMCFGQDVMTPMVKKVPALRNAWEKPHPVSEVQCPDGNSCQDDETCCQMQDKSYGCCGYQHATCCSDDEHCCPHGYTCDTAGTCRKGDVFAVALRKVPARRPLTLAAYKTPPTDHRCPDGAECDDDQTCCELKDHSYGCCPYNDAVCCPDLEHCCPNGYTCDTKEAKCIQSYNRSMVSLRRLSPRPSRHSVEFRVLDTTCKDGHICPGETTCCPTPSGRYNCCPFASGVCCSDGEHCCPQGFQCDLTKGRCVKDTFYPFLKPMLPRFPSSALRP
ncbi:unnamed protein product, partial [Ixodes hexagonus]